MPRSGASIPLFMSPEDSTPAQSAPSAAVSKNVTLSRWVNEQFPAWEQLLSAHDVARLTRRPRWVLLGMLMLRQFPRKHRFHGRAIGWLRADVLDWMARDIRNTQCHSLPASVAPSEIARQGSLPPGRAHSPRRDRKSRGSCMESKNPHACRRSSRQ
jgi:predicted DNA-binding transcriptional regulator AlpA